ncbi:MAG TPA: xanthine dehydrogenase family protein subunit M [Candidatus Polarisedimenticolia bacterium]|nr:xanthine dehydrogenase family protein subunit M [Candidatus Polarisedimenticolia bacterium]
MLSGFEYTTPATLNDALELLAESPAGVAPIAGGTDLITQMRTGIAAPRRLVSLASIAELACLEINEDGLRAGALTPLVRIASDPQIRTHWTALAQGAGAAASPQIRNAGTLGGNLCQRPRCWYFRSEDFHCRKKGGNECFALEGENKYHAIFGGDDCRIVHPSDTAPALIAFGAEVSLRSARGDRRLPLESFFALPSADVTRENVLERDEIVAELRVPNPPPGTRSAYLKVKEKDSFDFAMVSCAAVLSFDGDRCTRARLVLGGVAPIPWRCAAAEQLLEDRPLGDDAIAACARAALEGASPLSKNRYKVLMAQAAIRRVLASLASSPD